MNYLDIFPHDIFSEIKSRLSPGPAHNFRLAYETDKCAPSMYSCDWLVVMLAFESSEDPDKEKYPERVQMRIALSMGLIKVLDFIYRRHVFDEYNFMSTMTSYMDIALSNLKPSSVQWILDLFIRECDDLLIIEIARSVCFAACKYDFKLAVILLIDNKLRLAPETLEWAMKYKRLSILKFAHEEGLEWDKYSLPLAIASDDLLIFHYVRSKYAPYYHELAIAAARILPETSYLRSFFI